MNDILNKTIRARDGNRCQHADRLFARTKAAWITSCPARAVAGTSGKTLSGSANNVKPRKANRLPHEAGLRLLKVPRAPRELPVTGHLRNAHGVAEWKPFINE